MSNGEFAWIRELATQFGAGALPDGVYGIGDDAAIIPSRALGSTTEGVHWAVSVDSQVSGIHFRPGWLSWSDLGSRLLNVGFSDIAAMGASPSLALVSVEVGPEITADDRRAFAAGMGRACAEIHARLIGGNVSARTDGFSAHVTAIGLLDRGTPLLRSGAEPGDGLYVTGCLGAAAAGLEILQRGLSQDAAAARSLVESYRQPRAHWREGLALSAADWAHGAIDISDGLAADLGHLCRASGVGAVLESGAIPLGDALCEWCRTSGRDPLDLALNGGEDYVLLFAAPAEARREDEVRARFESFGGGLWRIGVIADARQVVIDRDGKREQLPGGGYDHLMRGTRPGTA